VPALAEPGQVRPSESTGEIAAFGRRSFEMTSQSSQVTLTTNNHAWLAFIAVGLHLDIRRTACRLSTTVVTMMRIGY